MQAFSRLNSSLQKKKLLLSKKKVLDMKGNRSNTQTLVSNIDQLKILPQFSESIIKVSRLTYFLQMDGAVNAHSDI